MIRERIRYGDRWTWCAHLRRLVEQYGGKVNPALRRAMAAYAATDRVDDGPPGEVMDRIEAAWSQTPLEERLAICNGWMPEPPTAQDRTQCESGVLAEGMQRYIVAEGSVGFSVEQECSSDHCGSIAAVQVRVLHGTPREQAMGELRRIMGGLEAHWTELIRGNVVMEDLGQPAGDEPPAPAENDPPIVADDESPRAHELVEIANEIARQADRLAFYASDLAPGEEDESPVAAAVKGLRQAFDQVWQAAGLRTWMRKQADEADVPATAAAQG